MPPKKPPCGNPLFLSWIEELRDQARERGTKAYDVYSKAARSLNACPVTYARPRDLVCLVGIGPKTVSILEGKWIKHCEENGLPPPGTPPKLPAKSKKSRGTTPDSATGSEADIPEPPKAKKRKTPAIPKTYIPVRGSGGYGILLGLLLLVPNPQIRTQVFVTKSELIRAAQPYSDSSYEHSEKGTYFNAWNSMKTLIGKGYVYVTGNPHKFCLTEEGYEVACAIRQLRPEMAGETKYPFIHETLADVGRTGSLPGSLPPSQTPEVRPVHPPPVESSSRGESSKHPSPRRSSGAGKFQFWYIDSAGSRVPTLNSAMVRLDPEEFINIRKVEFLISQKTHPFATQLKLVEFAPSGRPGSVVQTMFGYIVEEGAPPNCSKFDDILPKSPVPAVALVDLGNDGIFDDDWVDPPVPARTAKNAPPIARPPLPIPARVSGTTFARTASAPAGPSIHPSPGQLAAEAAERRAAQAVAAGPSRTHSATAEFALPSKPRPPAPRLSSHIPLRTPLLEDDENSPLQTSVNLPDFTPSDAIIYPAGTYDIVLVLDTREVESKTSRDKFAQALLDKGVRVETRALRLGDMCWVAKRRDGIGGEEDECVLDYVVERKRLDDLCSSIKDGRYTEQCFRLGNSCINNVYYIVEDFQTGHHMEYSGLQIMTAKSQIQVHNRFFLKETHKLTETIQFLTTMTDIIVKRHSQRDLHIIPTRYLSRSSYSALQSHLKKTHPSEVYHTSFEAYQELNDKSGSKTLREAFARMLFCVKGMSAERVSAVLDGFDTPKALWEAMKIYEEMGGEVDEGSLGKSGKKKGEKRGKELFFADRIQGEGRRKVGDALSKDLWRAFMGSTSRE